MRSIINQARRPDVVFFPSGRIDIMAHVARGLHIASGDIISVGEHCGEYFLYVRCRADEAVGHYRAACRPTKRGSGHCRAYCAELCRAVARLTGCEGRVGLAIGAAVEIEQYGMCLPLIMQPK